MAEAPASPIQLLRLVSLGDGLTYDEYRAIVCAHPKWKLLGPRRIRRQQVCGTLTWRVALFTWAGTPTGFCLEFDRPACPVLAEELDGAMEAGESTSAEDARRPRWALPRRWSQFTRHFTARAPRRPALRADRDRGPEMSIEDFREVLRRRPEFLAEAVALAAAKGVGVEKKPQAIDGATTGEPSAAQ